MKILVINTNLFEVNGISNVIMNYFRNIDKENFQMDFIAINKIDKIYRNEIKKSGGKIYLLKNRTSNTFAYIKDLINIIKKNNYDIIHVHGSSAIMTVEMIAGIIAGVKIRIAHSHNSQCIHKNFDKLLRPIFYLTYTHGLACSEIAGKWLFRNRDFKVLKNGIDIDKFRFNNNVRKEVRERLNIQDSLVLGHIGKFNEAKNHKFLIDVLNDISKIKNNVKLILVGDGNLRQDIRDSVIKLGLEKKVIFYGETDKVQDILQCMDIFCFPSLYEGLGIVLLEAQVSGLACVVSDRVPKEVKMTKLVKFLNIDNGIQSWINFINSYKSYNRELQSKIAMKQIRDNGYSNTEVVKQLEKIYSNIN